MAGLLVGGLLHLVRPWPVPARGGAGAVAGAALLLAGLVVVAAAVRAAGPTTLGAEDALVTDGPYRYSRHPMYVGWTALYVGLALLVGVAWPLVLLPLVAVAVHRTVRREERALERRHGDAYRAYARDVPRYL